MPAKQTRPTTYKWRSDKYSFGYTVCIGDTLYTRIGDDKRSTGLRCRECNKADALRALEQHCDEHLHPGRYREEDVTIYHPKYSIFEVIRDYKAENWDNMTPAQRKHFSQMALYYFEKNLDLVHDNERPSDDPVYRRILQQSEKKPLQSETKRKYLLLLRRLLTWAVLHKIIKVNTVDALTIPKKKKKKESDKMILFPDQIKKLSEFFIAKHESQIQSGYKWRSDNEVNNFLQYEATYRLLYATAMRPGELLKLKRTDVIPGKLIKIDGKGSEYREFPLSRFPDADQAVRDLLEYNFQNDKLVRWHKTEQLEYWFRQAREALNWDPRTVMYSLRASAEWRWENELFLSYDLICDIAGHEPQVREAYYRQKRKAPEMEKTFDHQTSKS